MTDISNYFHLFIVYFITAFQISMIFYLIFAVATRKVFPASLKIHLLRFVSIIYICIVLLLTLSSFGSSTGKVNLIPFKEMIHSIINEPEYARMQLLFNILLFVPLGVFLPWNFTKLRKIHLSTFFGCLFSLSIEIIQITLLRGRAFDIDDVVLNTFGVIVGYMFFVFFRKLRKKIHLKQ